MSNDWSKSRWSEFKKDIFDRQARYQWTRWLFLRGLGVVSLIAFVSFWVQLEGLIGQNGILPVQQFLERVADQLGSERYYRFPTLFWIGGGDIMLHMGAAMGALASLFLIFNITPAVSLLFIWGLYLSLCVAGQVFMQYQWDNLLIETTFLAIFIAPWKWWPRGKMPFRVNLVALWLLRLLLFKLILESGMVKWASGDPTWRNFTALEFHYFTQPLPTVFAWFAHQMPDWLLRISTFLSLAIEMGVPLLIITTRKLRQWAGAVIGILMILIGITGNYGFFNLLGLVLCVSLFDDRALKKGWNFFSENLGLRTVNKGKTKERIPEIKGKEYILYLYAVIYLVVSVTQMTGITGSEGWLPEWTGQLNEITRYTRTINNYGLFANMTTHRPEIVVQGSRDGQHWKTYRFKYKPGRLKEPPTWVQPHMPRLDWQMWFAALGAYRHNPWFIQFLAGLLQNKKPVMGLIQKNPFPDTPPRYIRAVQFRYRFTTISTWWKTGKWWERERQGLYVPSFSLEQLRN